MTLVTDRTGTARHAAGAPASQGGQFASKRSARHTGSLAAEPVAPEPASRAELETNGAIPRWVPLEERPTIVDPYWRETVDRFGLIGDECDWLDAHLTDPDVQEQIADGASTARLIADSMHPAIRAAEADRDHVVAAIESGTGVDAHFVRDPGSRHPDVDLGLALRWSTNGRADAAVVTTDGRHQYRVGGTVYERAADIPAAERKARKVAAWLEENQSTTRIAIGRAADVRRRISRRQAIEPLA